MDPPPPPPSFIVKDNDLHAADSARQRLTKKPFIRLSLSLPDLRLLPPSHKTRKSLQRLKLGQQPEQRQEESVLDAVPIALSPSSVDDQDEYEDKYEWAIVYENQRGYACLIELPFQ